MGVQEGTIFALAGLLVTLVGYILQYIFPIKKSKIDENSIAANTAKTVADTYSTMTKSLIERIESLEEEAENYKKEIQELKKRLEDQEKTIELLEKELKGYRQNGKG